eukprot:EG_transcript_22832
MIVNQQLEKPQSSSRSLEQCKRITLSCYRMGHYLFPINGIDEKQPPLQTSLGVPNWVASTSELHFGDCSKSFKQGLEGSQLKRRATLNLRLVVGNGCHVSITPASLPLTLFYNETIWKFPNITRSTIATLIKLPNLVNAFDK